MTARLSIASYPGPEKHPYLTLFYRAMERHGLESAGAETRGSLLDSGRFRRGEQPDVLHLHWPEGLWRAGSTLRRLPWRLRGLDSARRILKLAMQLRRMKRGGTTVVWTVHNVEPHEVDTFADPLGHRVIAALADLRICHSAESRAAVLARYGGAPDRTIVMYHGNFDGVYDSPGEDRETVLGRLHLDTAKRTLLCFGLIREYKGFGLAVQALRRLGAEYQLVIAGRPRDDGVGSRLESEAAGVLNVRLILRSLEDQEIADLLRASDCVLLPYRRITGSGALLAALTAGVPVVASALPYFREILALEPSAGVLHAPDDAEDLARAIRELFARPLPERRKAARRLSNRFRWEELVRPVAERLQSISHQRQRDAAATPGQNDADGLINRVLTRKA